MYTNNKFLTHLSFLQGLRVLVVDDNVDFCYLITLLQPYGVEVQKAFSVQQALEICGHELCVFSLSDRYLLQETLQFCHQSVKFSL